MEHRQLGLAVIPPACFWFYESGSHRAQADLKSYTHLEMALNFWSSCFCLQSSADTATPGCFHISKFFLLMFQQHEALERTGFILHTTDGPRAGSFGCKVYIDPGLLADHTGNKGTTQRHQTNQPLVPGAACAKKQLLVRMFKVSWTVS